MKICLVHNEYGKLSGEEMVVRGIEKILINNGHEVIQYIRYSADIKTMKLGKVHAFFSGIYSLSSRKKIRALLEKQIPDVVHIHNLFPLISPSILSVCYRMRIPVVMTVHNYRLICPSGLFLRDNEICEKCSGGREYWCLIHNCENDILKSLGYCLRNAVARILKFYKKNVSIYAALTEFQRRKLIAEGFPSERIAVAPNMAEPEGIEPSFSSGKYVGYIGRISPEKGINLLLSAARSCLEIPFKAAGNYDLMPDLPSQAPSNFEFIGYLTGKGSSDFYERSRIIVLCSTWYEGFPMVLVEAMLHGKPIICPRIGCMPEIVEEGISGLLFESGDYKDLASKIRYLWERSDLCQKMGIYGREKAIKEYSAEKYYERLISLYHKSLEFRPS